jgi:methylmalonyl-CoA carboxyltransferase 12S subunit
VVFNLADLLIAALLIGVGCVLTYVGVQRALKRAVSELQRATDRKLNALTEAFHALEIRSELRIPVAMSAAASASEAVAKIEAATAATAALAQEEKQEEVAPEILVLIAASVTAFLGKKVRIRSAKMLQSPYEIVNPWSQQGRVFVQASHNLRSRG